MGKNISENVLDEKLSAYFGRESQEPFVFVERRKINAGKIAFCTVMTVLVAVVVWIAVFRAIPNENGAPREKTYSFSAEKLAALCREKPVWKKTAEKNVGAWQPEIEYADGEKVVFSVASGVFVFDCCSGEFINTFDLEKLGVPSFSQGDTFSSLEVSSDGGCGLLYSHTTGKAPEYTLTEEYRELDLKSGTAKRLDSGEEFYNNHEVFQTSPVSATTFDRFPKLVFGEMTATAEENDYLIALDFKSGAGSLGSLRLIIMNSSTGEIKSIVSVFEDVINHKVI